MGKNAPRLRTGHLLTLVHRGQTGEELVDQGHRRRRWQARVATGDTQALNLVALLAIAEPRPVAA